MGNHSWRIASHLHLLRSVDFNQRQVTVILTLASVGFPKDSSLWLLSFRLSILANLIPSTLTSGPVRLWTLRNSDLELNLVGIYRFRILLPAFTCEICPLHQYFQSFSVCTGPSSISSLRTSVPNSLAFFKLVQMKPIFRSFGLREVELVQPPKEPFFSDLRLHVSLLSLTWWIKNNIEIIFVQTNSGFDIHNIFT